MKNWFFELFRFFCHLIWLSDLPITQIFTLNYQKFRSNIFSSRKNTLTAYGNRDRIQQQLHQFSSLTVLHVHHITIISCCFTISFIHFAECTYDCSGCRYKMLTITDVEKENKRGKKTVRWAIDAGWGGKWQLNMQLKVRHSLLFLKMFVLFFFFLFHSRSKPNCTLEKYAK